MKCLRLELVGRLLSVVVPELVIRAFLKKILALVQCTSSYRGIGTETTKRSSRAVWRGDRPSQNKCLLMKALQSEYPQNIASHSTLPQWAAPPQSHPDWYPNWHVRTESTESHPRKDEYMDILIFRLQSVLITPREQSTHT